MKPVIRMAAAGLLAWLGNAIPAAAQTPVNPAPVTRILAIGTVPPGTDLAAVQAILPQEVAETVKLYLAGKIDQWFSLADRPGVVFLLNVTDVGEAHRLLEALPLGRAHLMHFDLTPLAPLAPLRRLPGLNGESPQRPPPGGK